HTRNGNIPLASPNWIDSLVRRAGFTEAMLKAGWLKETPQGVTISNFEKWLGRSAKSRADACLRKRASRSLSENVTPMCDRVVTDSISHSYVNSSQGKGGVYGEPSGGTLAEKIRAAMSITGPDWFPAWAARHAARFSLRRDDDPAVLAGWWIVFMRFN